MTSYPVREEPQTFAHGPVLAYDSYPEKQEGSMVKVIPHDSETDSDKTLQTMEELNQLLDVDGILDKVLLEARQMADADAGTIFLLDKGELQFSYVQNDTLFKEDATNKMIYADYALPVDESSIVGYVALSGEPLAIDDAYELSSNLPWSFNRSFDQQTGYRTISILTIPLRNYQNRLVGVMQLINARDEMGLHTPFTLEHRKTIPLLANKASAVIDRGLMIREQILRMMRMASMRDPAETAGHVQRVGAYVAEIYKRHALNRAFKDSASLAFSGNPEGLFEEVKRTSGLMRLAAMLHDVGKVGIADAILKKPDKLTDEEFVVMRQHSIKGAQLFANTESDLDKLCYDIALHHHEKWAGGGYPGRVQDIYLEDVPGEPLHGEDIPLAARITALADVYDALLSKRMYKEPWPEEKVLGVIKEESGRHFDPEVVEAFFEIYDVIKAIQEKFKG